MLAAPPHRATPPCPRRAAMFIRAMAATFQPPSERPTNAPPVPSGLPEAASYDGLRDAFRWRVPQRFNIAAACCDAWAEIAPGRPCLVHFDPEAVETFRILTYGELRERSAALAADMARRGVGRGDRVALLLPQGHDAAVAHMAIYRLGAVAVPLALLFGAEALAYRLAISGARAVVASGDALERIDEARGEALRHVYCPDGGKGGAIDLPAVLAERGEVTPPVETSADDPALMIFTSGTTGPPKGALHAHRVLIGHVPGVQTHHMPVPVPGDVFWTPADWAWAGGLLNVLLPGLLMGVPVVSGRAGRFDPELAFETMARTRASRAFMPPTALRLCRAVERPRERFDLRLRTVGSGGEQLGAAAHDWAREALGVTVNEFYGQTECNLVLSGCEALGVADERAIGRPVPGHEVAVIGDDGHAMPTGEVGQIAVRAPDPVMFLEYWQRPDATKAKFRGPWMLTGDRGLVDGRGLFRFEGRDDDVITSAGFRIGPGEIEDCLTGHPDVALAAAVGKPDPVRTEIVKAYVVLREGVVGSDDLAAALRAYVKRRLSAHEYPREIDFLDALPLTTTGKVIRRELRERARAEAERA